jgi:hypothetical protein
LLARSVTRPFTDKQVEVVRSLANGTRAGLILGRALALDAIGWPRALDDRCDATEQALSTSWRGCCPLVLVSPAARQT